MKPFSELTRLGRLRRIRRLAEAALDAYGLGGTSPKLRLLAGNALYRVNAPDPESDATDEDLFTPGQYLLRIYQPGWQAPEALKLELAWLAAMRKEAGLPVPEPVPRLDGGLLAQVSITGIPQGRNCALLRWVKGRLLADNGRPEHYRAQGRLMGRIHNFTQTWTHPLRSSKRRYDWDGLFMNDPEIGLPPGKCWEYLPPDWVAPFEEVTRQFRQLMAEWGTGDKVYGLIHADMGLDANVLFWRGQPRLIDFDGSGFGYWMYDLAVALAHCIGTPNYERFREALFEGYAEQRSLPEAQVAQIDLFTAAFYVYYILWIVGIFHLRPDHHDDKIEELMYRGAAFILRFVGRDTP